MKHSQYFLTVLAGFLASASATHVYLHPPASSSLTNKPNLLLAQYLSLERFHSLDSNDLTENLEAYSQGLGNFVGKGLENVVLLGVGEEEIAGMLLAIRLCHLCMSSYLSFYQTYRYSA